MKHELVSQSLIFPENDFTNDCVRTSPIGDQQWWPSITIGTVADNGDEWVPNQSPSATQYKKGSMSLGKERERERES